MRIGIVTFWKSEDNYGQILQAFALYKYLESKGHNCFIVKYNKVNNFSFISKIFTAIQLLKNPQKIIKLKTNKSRRIASSVIRNRQFNVFREKWLNFSKECSHKELQQESLTADAFVCGSDQIWGGMDSMMYLSFAPKYCKKIAFAPSFGGFVPNLYSSYKIRRYLKSFDFVSCREKSGVELCKSLGRKDAVIFPDPTLMHQSDFYNNIVADKQMRSPYVFVYLLGNQMDFDISLISDFADENGLKILFVTGQNGVFSEMETAPATIEEWLSGIKNAEYVITNSFHGTVFSLIFHKKFMTIPLTGMYTRMNVRIYELMDKYGLNDRIYQGNIDNLKRDIDYSIFDSQQLSDIDYVNSVLKEHV